MEKSANSQSNPSEDRLTVLVKAIEKMRSLDNGFNQTTLLEEYKKLVIYLVRHAQQINHCPSEEAEALKEELCDTLENRLKALEKTVPATEPRIFHNKTEAKIASSPPVVSTTKALLSKNKWNKNDKPEEIACFRHEAKNNNQNFIEHYISNPGDVSLLPWREAQEIIDSFGFNSAKLHLLLSAHTMSQEKPWESRFSVKASDIAKDLGWSDRKPKTEQLLEIARTAFALDCLLVKTVWIEGRNKKGGIDASAPVGRMWNITITPYGQMDSDGKVEEPTEIYLTIQPGGWTQHFLNKAGNKSREALYQFGYMSKQVLQLTGSTHNELALRLAIHLTLESRCHQSGEYRVRTLIESALGRPAIELARSNPQKAYVLKQRWDNSLKLLSSIGWEIDYDNQTYPQWLRPDSDEQRQSKQRQPKGYLDSLLDAKVVIKPTNAIQQKLAKIKKPSKSLPSNATPITLTGFLVKDVRKTKGWTQCQLAKALGISKQFISHIELDKRTVSSELANRIRQVLDM